MTDEQTKYLLFTLQRYSIAANFHFQLNPFQWNFFQFRKYFTLKDMDFRIYFEVLFLSVNLTFIREYPFINSAEQYCKEKTVEETYILDEEEKEWMKADFSPIEKTES